MKVWIHECQRVFFDRLISIEDQQVLNSVIKRIVKENQNFQYFQIEKIFEREHPLQYAAFLDSSLMDIQNFGIYEEVKDPDHLHKILTDYIDMANQVSSKFKLNIVLFEDCMHHIVKLVRMICFPQGHALLVGTGGSGRTSLAYLAAFITCMEMHIINQGGEDWRDQVKHVMQTVGVE